MDRVWILMTRKMAGEASEEELQELNGLLKQDPSLQYAFAVMQGLDCREREAVSPAEEKYLLQSGLASIDEFMEEEKNAEAALPARRPVSPKRLWAVIACSLLVMLAGGYALRSYYMRGGGLKNEITTGNASRTTIMLPDGTKVWLNSGSRLRYADGFVNGNRIVTLHGEAFFDVKQDASHPFIIRTEAMDVKVLGTTLNVKAYPEDDVTGATLITGKVAVILKQGNAQEIVLQPGQKITVHKEAPAMEGPEPAAEQETLPFTFTVSMVKKNEQDPSGIPEIAWTQSRLEFNRETLEELSHDLERWYNVKIHFANDKYKSRVFTGTFKDQDIGEVLHALQLTSDFHYRIDSVNQVYIW